jgi:hypothetical protein
MGIVAGKVCADARAGTKAIASMAKQSVNRIDTP